MITRGQGDLEDQMLDPRLDSEALLLAALLWTRQGVEAREIVEKLCRDDFFNVSYGAVFEAIAELISENRTHDGAAVRSHLLTQGSSGDLPPSAINSVMLMLTTLDHVPEQAGEYARQVAGAAYRRQFADMAERLRMIAETAAQDQLFELLVDEGRKQRQAWRRIQENFAA
ncbi:DnaB-like helicase N-terminal domain-containing protein [Corynebacterium sp. CCM 9203]|uniref:DnaB-like helicase N-terminal domain-containing protein n=1 Tax=Corynebacterium sp. CCM 9203 TaxID=3057615 RepID=UPI003523F698